MKKLISYLVMVMMVFTMIPYTAFAGSETNEEVKVSYTWVNPIYEDAISEADLQLGSEPISTFSSEEVTYATTPEEAAAVVREYMVNRVESYTLYYKIPAADVEQGGDDWFGNLCDQIFPKAMEHTGNPCEGDYIRYTYGGYNILSTSISGDGTYYYLPLPVQMTYYTTYDQEEQLTEEVNAVLSDIITDGMTDYEKVKAIYDYMTSNISYDYEHYGNNSYKLQFTAYAAMVNKTSVCQGYANLFYRLALECGIDNRIISGTSINNQGNSEGHAWNIVKLGSKYYNVDATWDSTWDSDKTTHDFFLKGSEDFSNHTRDSEYTSEIFNSEYSMDTSNYVVDNEDSGEEADRWDQYIADDFSGGDGTEQNPYIISTPEELALLAYNVNSSIEGYSTSHYELVGNIDLSEHEWAPIGYKQDHYFKGNFDGKGYTVEGMYIKNEIKDCTYYGLFGVVANGYVKNLQIANAILELDLEYEDPFSQGDSLFEKMAGNIFCGGIAGELSGVVENCDIELNTDLYSANCSVSIGGIAGNLALATAKNNSIKIGMNCESEREMKAGGIAGVVNESSVESCGVNGYIFTENDGRISSELDSEGYYYAHHVGGIASGPFGTDVTFKNCYSLVDIYAKSRKFVSAGGIVGSLEGLQQEDISFENVYCNSTVTYNDSMTDNKDQKRYGAFFGLENIIGAANKTIINNCGGFRFDRFYKIENINEDSANQLHMIIDIYDINSNDVQYLFEEEMEYDTSIWEIDEQSYPTIIEINDNKQNLETEYDCIYGECGENVKWKYGENGVLNITGYGKMSDIETGYDIPWTDVKTNIYEVYIEDGVETLFDFAFWEANNLSYIELPKSLKEIGHFALMSGKYKELYIPENVSIIGQDAIDSANLEAINVDINNDMYSSEQGVLFDKEKDYLIKYPAGKKDKQYVIPESVISIYGEAFKFCSFLEKIELHNKMDNINSYSFSSCYSLKEIYIPASVEIIGDYAFAWCNNLESIYFQGEIPEIEEQAFGSVTATAYYNNTCITDVSTLGSFGGEITWIPIEHVHTEEILKGIESTCTETGLSEGIRCKECRAILVKQEALPLVSHDSVKIDGYSATCTNMGLSDYWQCNNCGWLFGDEKCTWEYAEPPVIPATGHTGVIDAGTDATCTKAGVTEGSHCGICNETLIEQIVIPATGHTEVIDVAILPTCTKSGLNAGLHCSVCNEVLIAQEKVDAIGHTEVIQPAVAETCTTDGLTEGKYCSVCDTVFATQEVIPATGHNFIWIVETPATDIAAGSKYEECTDCGEKRSENTEIPKLDCVHDMVKTDAVAVTCTTDGNIEYYTCSNCGNIYTDAEGQLQITADETKIVSAGHKYKKVVTSATCTSDGYTTYSCSVCGDTYTSDEKAATGHTPVTDAAKLPTCTEKGITAGSHCSVCSETIVAQSEVAALGHDKATHAAQDATCTEPGWKAYETCTRCDYTTYDEIEATGHTEVVDAAVTATCTKTGLTSGSHCSICNTVIKAQETVAAKGHAWKTKFTVDKAATMTAPGSKSKHCINCNATTEVTKIKRIKTATMAALIYNGYNRAPNPIIKDFGGKQLKRGTDYTVIYKNKAGKKVIKPKLVGKYTAEITFKGDYNGTIKRQFNINPKGPGVVKLSKNGKKQFTAKWTKRTVQVTGYQIKYGLKGKTAGKTVNVKNIKTNIKSIKGLKSKKTYWVQVRTYKTVGGVKYYSNWTVKKFIKTK